MIIERFATKSPCWKTNLQQQALPSEKQDSRYREFYETQKPDLMLHSLGCARASADYQSDRWNQPDNNSAIAHAVVDSNDGDARQNLRWDMRGWHCGQPGNNRTIGVEMCESDQIEYYDKSKPWLFRFKNKAKAQQHCKTAYQGAVELFAELCVMFALDPLKNILSHKEGHARGIASNHGDPEHYWDQMGLGYTMNGFRRDVKKKMEEMEDNMNEEKVKAIVSELITPLCLNVGNIAEALGGIRSDLQAISERGANTAADLVELKARLDRETAKLDHVADIPWKGVREAVGELVHEGYINGGTSAEVDPEDINMGLEDIRVLAVMKRYVDAKAGGNNA